MAVSFLMEGMEGGMPRDELGEALLYTGHTGDDWKTVGNAGRGRMVMLAEG